LKNLVFITVVCFLYACDNNSRQKVVAQVYGQKLYATEITPLIAKDASYEDSVFLTKEYINIWITEQVLLHEAYQVLSEKERDKSDELQAYQNDLLRFELVNKLIAKELDTTFAEEELELYYEENRYEFELSQNIIKLIFYKIPSDAKNIDLLWSSFKVNDQSVYSTLLSLSQKGGNHFEQGDRWVFFDDILKEIPINTYNQEHYLNNHKYIRISDADYTYFIRINDFKTRSTTSPFDIEKQRIRTILLTKRQQELQKMIESKLIERAYQKNQVALF